MLRDLLTLSREYKCGKGIVKSSEYGLELWISRQKAFSDLMPAYGWVVFLARFQLWRSICCREHMSTSSCCCQGVDILITDDNLNSGTWPSRFSDWISALRSCCCCCWEHAAENIRALSSTIVVESVYLLYICQPSDLRQVPTLCCPLQSQPRTRKKQDYYRHSDIFMNETCITEHRNEKCNNCLYINGSWSD